MPPRNKNTRCQLYFFGGLGLIFVVFIVLNAEWSFPAQFRHLQPEEFQSHQYNDLSPIAHQWQSMQTFILNSSLTNMCEDIEITKDNIGYCINRNNSIIEIDVDNKKMKRVMKLKNVQQGERSYGLRLSRDENLLYFAHSSLGLCEFDIESKSVRQLFTSYLGKRLLSLNSIETHPTKSHILYITQSSSQIPLKYFNIDIIMNLPYGRVFEYNKKLNKLSLLADGLHFANGIVFQMYDGEETVLVAESNRLRLTRVWVSREHRGRKQVAVDKLDIYLDNMKANEKGQLWIAGPSMRNYFLYFADHHPWIRRIISRIPPQSIQTIVQDKLFGGMKIIFSNRNKKCKIEYFLWEKIDGWKFTTAINQRNNRLFLSSLKSNGILVVDDLQKQLKRSTTNKQRQQKQL